MINEFKKIDRNLVNESTYILLIYIHNALRTEEFHGIIYQQIAHTFWWHLSGLSVFQTHGHQESIAQRKSISSMEHSVHYAGGIACTCLSDHPWSWTDRNKTFSPVQRSVSTSHRSAVEFTTKQLKRDYPFVKNPFAILPGQRIIFPHSIVFVYSSELVHTVLYAGFTMNILMLEFRFMDNQR